MVEKGNEQEAANEIDDPFFKIKQLFKKKEDKDPKEGGNDDEDGDDEKKDNLIQQIKNYGVAGAVSYGFWEGAFWILGGAGAYFAYIKATGHAPDFDN